MTFKLIMTNNGSSVSADGKGLWNNLKSFLNFYFCSRKELKNQTLYCDVTMIGVVTVMET